MWKKIKHAIFVSLAVIGALFVILMMIPDDAVEDTESKKIKSGKDTKVSETQESKEKNSIENMETVSVGTDAKSATIMVYVNGSDLESNAGEASTDISEMVSSGIGENVNVIIQTMGTKKWDDTYGIDSSTAQTYEVADGGLSLVRDNLGQLDCTSEETLSEFIGFCKTNYPAERYIFVFWDHGGGPVYGFGYDEWQDEGQSLTIAEMSRAFSEHTDIHFDMIGMDCCIMADIETCYALAPYCKYTLLSEDFESGLGWSYTNFMKSLEENPGMSTPLLGKKIIDDIIEDNEESMSGDSACIALFNESTVESLFEAWKSYVYKNEEALFQKNFSKSHKAKGRTNKGFWDSWESDGSNVTLSDYYITDILALVESVDNESDEARSLMSALKACVAYYGHTSDKNELTGMAVSLPYGDSSFYEQLKTVYMELGIDEEYINWLSGFVTTSGYEDYYDYDSFESSWGGWADYESDYGANISSGGECEYAFDYDSYDGDYYDYDSGDSYDDWIYDYEEEMWYLYDDDVLYLYDDESNIMYYYDEEYDEIYYYDEEYDEWYLVE